MRRRFRVSLFVGNRAYDDVNGALRFAAPMSGPEERIMSSPVTGASRNTINIDVVNDLKDGSHLKSLLAKDAKAAFAIGSELARFASQPIGAAAGSNASVTISAPTSWTTTTNIRFSLAPEAGCTVGVDVTSAKFSLAESIDSSQTQDIVSGPTDGIVYVNIELDFSIAGSLSGSGTAAGIGIAGKAAGSAAATLAFCHAVDASLNTIDAVKEAFSALVFPLEPDCALRMSAGDQGRVNVDGSVSFGLDVTYGLGSFKFSAPGVAAVEQSLQKANETLTLPTVEIDAGAMASFSYTHSDHFGAIVRKTAPDAAFLYLVRSAENETVGSGAITVGVSVTGFNASVDRKGLAAAINKVTGTGGDKAAALAGDVQSSLVSKTNKWLSTHTADAGLLVELSRQTNRALLYQFAVDLTKADLTTQSWERLAAADVAGAMQVGGLKLLPGSGVGTGLKRSVSVGLHFFNFFSASSTTTYFQNADTDIGPDGSIRFLFDVGKESDSQTKSTLETSRIHFVASANPQADGSIGNVEVDLAIELSETNKPQDGNQIAEIIGALPATAATQAAQTTMSTFIADTPKGSLTVASTFKPSAYLRLSCSPFTGAKKDIPPAPPQEQDQDNWEAFHDAARVMLGLNYLDRLTYQDWVTFNQYSNSGNPSGLPNRRNSGSPNRVPPSFYQDHGLTLLARYFLLGSADFMNLCDDLHALAGNLAEVDTLASWNSLLDHLTALAKSVEADWTRATARAILRLCGANESPVVTMLPDSDGKSLTCDVVVS